VTPLRYAGLALVLAGPASFLRADTTVRYHTDIEINPGVGIPVAAVDQALGGMRDMVIRIRGDKAHTSQGRFTSIVNLMTQDLTLIDPASKRFVTLSPAQYAEQLKAAVPAVPDQARAALAAMKTHIESRSTGRTASIQAIQAEEQEFVLTVDMLLPGGPAPSTPFMKMAMQVWTAKPEETQRVPALQEFRNYTAAASSSINPVEMIKQVLSAMPGLGDSLVGMVEERAKSGGLTLRTRIELSMPFLATIGQQLPGQAPPAGFDPNAPLMQMTQEVAELSASPVDEAIFQVPADYLPASLEEILRGITSAPTPPQFKQ
jgi:hypothetical protein